MKTTKYGKRKLKVPLIVLLVFVAFAAGAFAMNSCRERDIGMLSDRILMLETERGRLESELILWQEPAGDEREVQVEFVSCTDFLTEGDIVDLRVITPEGKDDKLLSGKKITKSEKEELRLIVSETELPILSEAEFGLETGTVTRIYAVRLP